MAQQKFYKKKLCYELITFSVKIDFGSTFNGQDDGLMAWAKLW